MFGERKHSVELGHRQSRQKAGPKPIGKGDVLVSVREFAHAIHKVLFSTICDVPGEYIMRRQVSPASFISSRGFYCAHQNSPL
jgi:hypothetical protein